MEGIRYVQGTESPVLENIWRNRIPEEQIQYEERAADENEERQPDPHEAVESVVGTLPEQPYTPPCHVPVAVSLVLHRVERVPDVRVAIVKEWRMQPLFDVRIRGAVYRFVPRGGATFHMQRIHPEILGRSRELVHLDLVRVRKVPYHAC